MKCSECTKTYENCNSCNAINFKITNVMTFNNSGSFDVTYKDKTYKAKWKTPRELILDAPKELYNQVLSYLYD